MKPQIICWGRNKNLGIEHNYNKPKDFVEDNVCIFKMDLYCLDHTYKTFSLKDFHDPWDSTQVGYIYIEKTQSRNEQIDEINKGKWVKLFEVEIAKLNKLRSK